MVVCFSWLSINILFGKYIQLLYAVSNVTNKFQQVVSKVFHHYCLTCHKSYPTNGYTVLTKIVIFKMSPQTMPRENVRLQFNDNVICVMNRFLGSVMRMCECFFWGCGILVFVYHLNNMHVCMSTSVSLWLHVKRKKFCAFFNPHDDLSRVALYKLLRVYAHLRACCLLPKAFGLTLWRKMKCPIELDITQWKY